MKLVIGRHAEAQSGADDASRHLTEAGKADAECMGRILKSTAWSFSDVRTSPLPRAQETAAILARGLGSSAPSPLAEARLAPGFDLEETTKILGELLPGQAALWVFHAPDVTRLASYLIGVPERAFYFPAGTLLAVNLTPPVTPGTGMLIWTMQPEYISRL